MSGTKKEDLAGVAGRFACLVAIAGLLGCAQVGVPGVRDVSIPAPVQARERQEAVNEQPDAVMYLPLGEDVLVPEYLAGDPLPDEKVGPFELRGETLAGALQLILADYEVPMAFETEEGLTRRVTVANLKGPLSRVVRRVCSLADLYCAFEDGMMIIKDRQTFTVNVPPVNGDEDLLDTVASGLAAITGEDPIVDTGTRTIVYTATQRTAEMAERYFQRLRSNTALVVFEIYIWEVSLDSMNSTGIDWEKIDMMGKFNLGVSIPGTVSPDLNPVSIGLPTTGDVAFGSDEVLQFISDFGAVKTISQPQITMLSGSAASLRVADTKNYVSSLERTVDEGEVSVSTETSTVDTGFTLTISSAWDNSTIYGTIDIQLQEFRGFEEFSSGETTLKLPETTERELSTQVRIRPGDSLLIAGLVRENDEYNSSGPGFNKPILQTSRSASVNNIELVFLMKPRVVAFTSSNDPRYKQSGLYKRREAARDLLQDEMSGPVLTPLPYDEQAGGQSGRLRGGAVEDILAAPGKRQGGGVAESELSQPSSAPESRISRPVEAFPLFPAYDKQDEAPSHARNAPLPLFRQGSSAPVEERQRDGHVPSASKPGSYPDIDSYNPYLKKLRSDL